MKRVLIALVLGPVLLLPRPAAALDPVWTNWRGLALRGWDPVAYFEEGRAVEGRAEFSHRWRGASWRFASAEHRERFAREPERFAPQYGGYCAYAVARGDTASIDPEAWKIVDGKLYLNYSRAIQAEWEKDVSGYIEKADRNWPRLLSGR